MKKSLILTFSLVESNNNPKAYNDKEQAAGLLQIRPIMLAHINKICKTSYTLNDRYDSLKSIEMFFKYQNYYNPSLNLEVTARLWNGGNNGMNKIKATQPYYDKILKQINP